MDGKQGRSPDDERPALGSAEYRARLLTKLNCLIAVLEVAIAKIVRSMDLPGANEERLVRIRSNLENTLSICLRAKQTLERRLLSEGSAGARSRQRPTATSDSMSYRDYVELSSIHEYQKFKTLPPIQPDELGQLDLDELARRLTE
jgi:hypothetical protein